MTITITITITITVMRAFCQKQVPISIKYRDYNKFDCSKFHTELFKKFKHFDMNNITYDMFELTVMERLDYEGKKC